MEDYPIKTYRDLIVWQKAHSLAKQVIMTCRSFPGDDEARVLKRQLIRCATSIPPNIAEGYGGYSGKAYQNYSTIARRSVNETDYWIFLAHDLKYIEFEKYQQLEDNCKEIILMLSKIIGTLARRKTKD